MPRVFLEPKRRTEPPRFSISAIAPLAPEEERRLALAVTAGSRDAFDQLVRAHVPLALSIARRFCRASDTLEDLVSEAMLGLVESIRRFDVERGVRLAAYAAFWIRAYVRRYTLQNRRIVRLPSTRNARRLLAHLRTTEHALHQRHGERPSSEAIADALSVSTHDVDEMSNALYGRDVPYEGEINGKVFELGWHTRTPESLLAEEEEEASQKRAVLDALSVLDARERAILHQRYLDEQQRSLAAIGSELGISRERVRQLESAAEEKLRAALFAQ